MTFSKPCKKRLTWFMIVVVFGVSVATCLYLWWREPMLLSRAATVMNLRECYHTDEFAEFYWLTDTKLLYRSATNDSTGNFNSGAYILRDINSGLSMPLPVLSKRIDAFKQSYNRICPSPDGQWIYMFSGHHMLMVCRMDGSNCRKWDTANSAQWLYNSHLLVEFEDGSLPSGAVVREIDPFGPATTLASLPPGEVLPDGDAARAWSEESEPSTLHIAVYDKRQEFKIKWQKDLVWPVTSTLGDIEISRQGDQIAFLLFVEGTQPLLQWAHRLIPRIPQGAYTRCELWVCRIDGTERKLLGMIPINTEKGNSSPIYSLCWLSDGNRLSLVNNDYLLLVDAR